MKIAICDDDPLELSRITSLLDFYRNDRGITLSYKSYLSAAELLATLKQNSYNLLLLDILMPGFTGIEAAQEVRTFDGGVNIIFLTSSPEFALSSYAVKARDYMLKPVSKDKLFSALDSIAAEMQESLDCFLIKSQSGIARILFAKLSFVEVLNKKLYFHLSDGTVREVSASLAEYEQQLLRRSEFVKVHRSYIVNLWQMSELTANGFITYNSIPVPISRLLYSNVRQIYLKHLFSEAGL